ncbi:hypothetical protein DFJ43DRAFT_466196 [Lentinula guzmanii]|uniref:Uncharacterized protein n=1 Tax=Lentinula guzmanii TaxID=2804957 RepID=A0AA38MSU1_9AGAR|nr:hypothetical protein DFJ43DRAFT_466196 [Lentinula guzmanii]
MSRQSAKKVQLAIIAKPGESFAIHNQTVLVLVAKRQEYGEFTSVLFLATHARILSDGTTTAPAPRRTRRTKAEIQEKRAMKKIKGTLSPDKSKSEAPSQILQVNATRTTTRELYNSVQFSPAYSHCVTTPLGSPNPVSPSFNLPPNLIAELFQTFRILPQSLHPVISLDEVESSLRLASWNLASLPSQLRLLAHIIITLASFFSTNAVIIGPGGYGPEIACIALSQGPLKEAAVLDLREYGVRRKPAACMLSTMGRSAMASTPGRHHRPCL